MKWIILPLCLLLASCLYVEGKVIEEPKDVVVGDSITKFAYWDRCGTVDISEPDRSTHTASK